MDSGIDFNIRPEEAEYFIPYGVINISKPRIIIKDRIITNSSLPYITVIIPSFLNFSLKRNTLKYLLHGIENSNVINEVIIVINNNDLDYEKYQSLSNISSVIKVLTTDEINNRSKSRNTGANAANNNYLLFIDDDMIIKDWRIVDNILNELIHKGFDVALFPRRHFLKYPNLYSDHKLNEIITIWRSNPGNHNNPEIFDPIEMNSPYKTIKFCFPGCFMIISKKEFQEINGFNDNFIGWGLEDAELSLRLIKKLKLLNLFLKTYPLLHIDHAVSPYKSDEHKKNYSQFKESFSAIDLDQMCNQVFTGNDFSGITISAGIYSPLFVIQKTFAVPLVSKTILNNFKRIIDERISFGLSPDPKWIILHGSRSLSINKSKSDFDILVLFKGGLTREYYSVNINQINVDLEYNDLDKYIDIVRRPYAYPLNGALELAKIANGIVLFGDLSEFEEWRMRNLQDAISESKIIWLVTLIGMQISYKKYGIFLKRFKHSLNQLFIKANLFPFNPNQKYQELIFVLKKSLDDNIPDWKDKTKEGNKIFKTQIPEQWKVLNKTILIN
jgi:predicted glycosyltransferase involved in capsule biosynthesis